MNLPEWKVLDATGPWLARLHLNGWSVRPTDLRPPVGDELNRLTRLGVPEGMCGDGVKRAKAERIPIPSS
jgi:hypothetical protein